MSASFVRKVHPAWILLGLLLVVCGGIRARLASMPLERDEGEYAYMAQGLLEGVPPYQETYLMKFPGTFLAYAGFLKFFGSSDVGIRTGLILLNSAGILVAFGLASRMVSFSGPSKTEPKGKLFCSKPDPNWTGFWAAAIYGIATLSPTLLGLSANAEHFMLLPAMLGGWLLLRASSHENSILNHSMSRKWTYLLAGICMGISVAMKQPALAFSLAGFFWIGCCGWKQLRSKEAPSMRIFLMPYGFYVTGVCLPLAAMAVWMKTAGVFGSFWFWCFEYARHYGGMWSWSDGARHFFMKFTPFFRDHWLIWGFAGLGMVVAWKRKGSERVFMTIWMIAGFVAMLPGLIFRPHYFLLVVPGLALAGAYGLAVLRSGIFVGGIALLMPVFLQARLFFQETPEEVSRRLYAPNAFPEMRRLAQEIQAQTELSARIVILGSEPQILFYANRRSASPYIEMYPLLEPQPFAKHMQRKFMEQLEAAPPPCLIHVRIPTSWLVYPDSDMTLLHWIPGFLDRHYRLERALTSTRDGFPSDPRGILVYRRRE